MSRLNNSENFTGRVNYAAAVISQGRRSTRAFDNCFENYDGDAVAAALVRRARKNEQLAKNLPRYLTPESVNTIAAKYEGRNLAEVSRELIAKRKAESAAYWAARDAAELVEAR